MLYAEYSISGFQVLAFFTMCTCKYLQSVYLSMINMYLSTANGTKNMKKFNIMENSDRIKILKK